MDAVIIGGGPAGSSAAIRLTQSGMSVRVYEKTHFPRPKLCGGFLSPESLTDLEQMGVLERVQEAGAIPVRRAVVSSCSGRIAEAPLPQPGLSLSREKLDLILIQRAREAGADIREGVNGAGHEGEAGWTIQASGRKSHTAGYTGLQAFFENVQGITDQVELDIVKSGYVGLVRQEDQRVNVCALTTRRIFQESGASLDSVLNTWKNQNPLLRKRLRSARRVSGWQSVGPVAMGVRQLAAPRTLFTGDAACVVDPFAGEGLAMSLRASTLLQQALAQSAQPAEEVYARTWRRTFKSSLRFHALTRGAIHSPWLHELWVLGLQAFPAGLTWLTAMTRAPYYRRSSA